jgi:phage tail-like protein
MVVPGFTVNPTRFDPYKGFKFRIRWDGRHVAGVSRISPLRRSTQAVLHRDGSDASRPRKSPGLTSWEPLTLERGRTHDTAFEEWANRVWNQKGGPGGEMSLADFRKDIAIELYNEAGQLVMSFKVYRCWPSQYVALSELQADDSATAFESLVIEHEGWERDTAVGEPQEPKLG